MELIYYGANNKYIDVTYICNLILYRSNKTMTIPKDDNARAHMFGDHLYGVLKHIRMKDTIYPNTSEITISRTVTLVDITKSRQDWWNSVVEHVASPRKRLNLLHKTIKLDFGSMEHEFPEQLMAIKYIKPTDNVLEIGGNIGRNSLVIATILNNDQQQMVTLESSPEYANQLKHNRDQNFYHFNIEAAALSEIPLWQQGWDTFGEGTDLLPPDSKPVNTITYPDLKSKYKINFNVLVADCEGALYQILKDRPEILSNIKTVIIENDFVNPSELESVTDLFLKSGFRLVYSRSLIRGPTKFNHCKDKFYQVYTRN